jgi:hypothetical protein
MDFLPDQVKHGGFSDYYLIKISEVAMVGDQNMGFGVELNIQNILPGTYKIDVLISSLKQNYKDMKTELSINIS